jgi:hypothetical protein
VIILNDISTTLKIKWRRSIRRFNALRRGDSNKKKFINRKFPNDNQQIFFGYYDVTPFSHNENLLLAMHVPIKNLSPKPKSEILVGYYDMNDEDPPFFKIGKTTTWCWQQGCRLQWYPVASNQEILYNRLVDGQYGCVIQDIESKEVIKAYKRPIYAVSKNGRWGLSLNFSRLHRLRPGYGYAELPDDTEGQAAPEADGIWRIDMKTGKEGFLFSIAEITHFEPLESMKGAEHYFNHILFNPDETRFMFFHVWLNNGKRYNRLITCDVDGKDRYALANEGHVSHYTWKSDDELLAYSTHADSGTNYHLYKDKTNIRKVIGKGILNRDGHPSFSPDGSLLLTDTYPDKYRDQHLLIYKLETGELHEIGAFYTPLNLKGEARCDLHPRWSSSGRFICFDSAHEGIRKMYLFDVIDGI